jgi:cobalt-zinc-cadmium efflux system outer membrane protein
MYIDAQRIHRWLAPSVLVWAGVVCADEPVPVARLLPPREVVAQAKESASAKPEVIPVPTTPQPSSPQQPALSLPAAIAMALENNPELRAFRQERGIAEAGVVIARTYPFNPTWEDKTQYNSGPASATITNQVATEHLVLLELELHGQRRYRQQGAAATLTKTEWDIATQELILTVRVIRAFQAVLYQRERLRLIEQTIGLNERTMKITEQLFNQGKLQAVDQFLARSEVMAARGLLGPARTALVTATYDLRRALGLVDALPLVLQGQLDVAPAVPELATATQEALQRRPELQANRAAVALAEAALNLEFANRFGNPVLGPAFTYDPTRISSAGLQLNLPLPVLNTHRGQIQQRQAEQAKAVLVLRQIEIQIRQDVEAAIRRLTAARAGADVYRTRILPSLESDLSSVEKLFELGRPGVDVLRIIDMRRKWISARDSYLTALWEVNQAQADLLAAIGALGPIWVPPAAVGRACP